MADDTNGKQAEKLVIIAAGGTGGHMFPARAFADEMRKRGWRVGLISDSVACIMPPTSRPNGRKRCSPHPPTSVSRGPCRGPS